MNPRNFIKTKKDEESQKANLTLPQGEGYRIRHSNAGPPTAQLQSCVWRFARHLKLETKSEQDYPPSRCHFNGSPYKSIRSAFKTACNHAKLSGVTPHILRHTFASRLAMAGVDVRTIQELGGWKELEMLQRYAHLSPNHQSEAVEKIANHFTTLFTTPVSAPSKHEG